MDGLEPIHEAQERDRKDPFLQRSVPLESNPGHLRTNDSPAKELTAGRSVRKRARARSRSAQNPENPPFEARALKQPLGSTVALQRSAAGFALEIAASLIMSPQTESRRARAGTASKVGVVNVPAWSGIGQVSACMPGAFMCSVLYTRRGYNYKIRKKGNMGC
jgi:hypothetical protein